MGASNRAKKSWRRLGSQVLVVLCSLCWPLSPFAWAQRGDAGTITGNIFDQTGTPLAGVKISAVSDTQIGGPRVTYTNSEGAFRFPALQPGVFRVRAEAPRLTTAVRSDVRVGINAPTEIDFVMDVATSRVEEIKVIERPPMVSTTSASVKETYDIDMVDSVAHDSRNNVFQQVSNYTAGSIRGGRIRGGGSSQTMYTMDGFNMLRQFPTLKSAAAYEVQTAGYGADNVMAPGGVVNLASRSGSNKFELELVASTEHSRMKLFTDALDPVTSDYFHIINPMVSGPIVKDRLWYSLNGELHLTKAARGRDAEGIQPDPLPLTSYFYKGTFKLTYQLTSRSKLQSVTNFDHYFPDNNTGGFGITRESQTRAKSYKYFTGLIWDALLSDTILFRSQLGMVRTIGDYYPTSCLDDPDRCDHIAPVIQRLPRTQTLYNATTHDRNELLSFQFINRLGIFWSRPGFGEHDIQLTDNLITQNTVDKSSVPGDRLFEYNGGPDALTTYFANDPRQEPARYGWFISSARSLRNVVSLTDAWKPTRHLTLTGGAAYTVVDAGNSRGGKVIRASALTPSMAVAWDATHDGRTVVRGSFNQYLDADVHGLASHTQGTRVSQRCRWDEASQSFSRECVYSGGPSSATVGLPCGASGVTPDGQSCRESLQIPRTWESTAGVEREVLRGVALAGDMVYRRFTRQYERLETNRLWNASGVEVDRLGGYRNGRPETVSDLSTPEGAERRYLGVTGGVTVREGRLKLRSSYTWSRLEGTVFEGLNNRWGDIGPRDLFLDGPLPDDHRHEVKLTLAYQVAPWLGTSVRYAYYSGLPYSRLYRNDTTGQFETYRARVGVDPGTNLNDPGDDRALRTPDVQSVNVQLSFNFQPLLGIRLESFVDVLNVLALRTTTSVGEINGQDFGVTRDREQPFRFRLGLRYQY